MAITDQRRRLLEASIIRLRALAVSERGRVNAEGRETKYVCQGTRNAEAHERQALALQAQLDAGGGS